MEQVPLGSSGLMVSGLGYGCRSLSYAPRDDEASAAVLRHALELGVTFFDTADEYGEGHNEELVGRVFAGRSDELVLASKLGCVGNPADPAGVDGRPEQARTACEASLLRLGLDVIDLYYLDRVDAAVPIEETVGAMAELVAAGKVRALGLSEAVPATIRRAHAVHPITALQTELSLCARGGEALLAVCRELGITFVARTPLGRGSLTGHVRGAPGNVERMARLCQMAAALRCTPGQLALAWLLAKGSDVVPIPGTRHVSHLEQNVAALHVEPSPAQLRTLDAVFPVDAPAARRKSVGGLEIVNR